MTSSDLESLGAMLDELLAVLELENEHVGRMELAPFREIQARKAALLEQLEFTLWRTAGRTVALEASVRETLGHKLQSVKLATVRNERRLSAAKGVVDRIMACVAAATEEPGLGLGTSLKGPPVIVDHRY